jgi:hypothetical protein
MAASLAELQKAIRGLVVMSRELELMHGSLLANQVRQLGLVVPLVLTHLGRCQDIRRHSACLLY